MKMATNENISLSMLKKKVENLSEITAHFNNVINEVNHLSQKCDLLGINVDELAETVHRNYERMSYDNRQYQKQIARDASQTLQETINIVKEQNNIIESSINKYDRLPATLTHIFIYKTQQVIDEVFAIEFNFNKQLNDSRLLIEAVLITSQNPLRSWPRPIWTYDGQRYIECNTTVHKNDGWGNFKRMTIDCVIDSNFTSGRNSLKLSFINILQPYGSGPHAQLILNPTIIESQGEKIPSFSKIKVTEFL